MTKNATTAERILHAALALWPLVAVSACTSAPAASQVASVTTTAVPMESAAQPPLATYACANGEAMTIRNVGTSIRLIGPNGMEEELPASPVNQQSRYGEAHDAIVLDGHEALVMRAGKTPVTCTR